jgi:hypothetical protein
VSGVQELPAFGYGVEFDNYANLGTDPSERHIGVIQDTIDAHLARVDDPRTEDNAWHACLVQYANGRVVVLVDGNPVLDYTLPVAGYAHNGVGFPGATGGGTNDHVIDGVQLRVPQA